MSLRSFCHQHKILGLALITIALGQSFPFEYCADTDICGNKTISIQLLVIGVVLILGSTQMLAHLRWFAGFVLVALTCIYVGELTLYPWDTLLHDLRHETKHVVGQAIWAVSFVMLLACIFFVLSSKKYMRLYKQLNCVVMQFKSAAISAGVLFVAVYLSRILSN